MSHDDELDLIGGMVMDLAQYRAKNTRQWAYYDGEAGIKNIGIAIPETLVDVEAIIGWPEIVVDALEERLDWQGWSAHTGDISGLEQAWRENQLGTETSKAILDSLVCGVGFLEVSAGGPGEPPVIVNAVPPTQATFRWDGRTNRVAAGLVLKTGPGGEQIRTLHLPDETVTTVRDESGEHVTRHHHGRGRCGLVVLPNRTRSGQARGKSEITRTIRYYTDHAIRTVLGMEYNREIYTTPQRWMKNVLPEDIGISEDATAAEVAEVGWQIAMNKALIIPPRPRDDDFDGAPDVGQFSSASPQPYIDQIRMLAQLVSAQSGVPASYLGFSTDNPPSADSIRMTENRLVKKAERRQAMLGQVLRNDLAYLVQSVLDGRPADPALIASLDVKWRDAATPTKAATTDATVKLVDAGVLPPRGKVVMDIIGLTPEQQSQAEADWARDTSRSLADMLRTRVVPQDPVVEDVTSRTRPSEEPEWP